MDGSVAVMAESFRPVMASGSGETGQACCLAWCAMAVGLVSSDRPVQCLSRWPCYQLKIGTRTGWGPCLAQTKGSEELAWARPRVWKSEGPWLGDTEALRGSCHQCA